MHSFTWRNIRVASKSAVLLDDVSGQVNSGSIMALMGPSGSGKTTLLSSLAHRVHSLGGFDILGDIEFDGQKMSLELLREVSRFVQQEDHLIGSLTVKESIDFSIRMAGDRNISGRAEAVDNMMELMGLTKQANTRVGTALRKGLSGGQKRRLSVAAQMVTRPKVLFLDEPTSGLDSKASFEVVQALKNIARTEKVIIIASIHQPSTSTFNLFDQVMFLSGGQVVYSGERACVELHFLLAGFPIPAHFNSAEFILELTNLDFADSDGGEKAAIVKRLVSICAERNTLEQETEITGTEIPDHKVIGLTTMWLLLSRNFIKARRDHLAYNVRIAMYLGLAILMGTVWLRLDYTQSNIQLFSNAIFFSGAFMSFMSVAYIPAYLEDYLAFTKERSNGLYGPLPFLIANFLIGVPFLFLIVIVFSVFTYFMCNFRHSGTGFGMYVMYLFINLLAAESLTIFISTVFPVFVIALALTAFTNGLWMAVGGFLVQASTLNSFWYYTFYWVDYQRYAFQGMMFNQFEKTTFHCGQNCQCMYVSGAQSRCMIDGAVVLKALGYGKSDHGLWIGIMICIIFVLRAATYVVLRMRT